LVDAGSPSIGEPEGNAAIARVRELGYQQRSIDAIDRFHESRVFRCGRARLVEALIAGGTGN
jgi:hypothetical protein